MICEGTQVLINYTLSFEVFLIIAASSDDEVEDIRLAVGEACATAIERAERSLSNNPELTITANIDENNLIISIEDQFTESASFENPNITDDDIDKNAISSLLMQLLVDDYSSKKVNDKTIVTITKYMGNK